MLTSALLTALLAPSPAQACGGFFCNNIPVEQSGEDILFAVDKEKNETTVHVQIAYEGPAEEFAWIVPVPQVPELVLSTDRLFQELGWRTQPSFGLEIEELFRCEGQTGWWGQENDAALSSSASVADTAAPPSDPNVNVVDESRVGPYETVTLQARTTADLLDWLQGNGYDLPNSLDPVLEPYVAEESYFVALKLAKEADTGQLQPLGMRYSGTGASVPIQLTSIAATEDMRLGVYLLGDSRAVPDSYLHVQVNDLVIDWWSGGSNWEDAITIAADEAGGHAFATDYSGGTSTMDDALYVEGRYDIDALALSTDAYDFFDELLRQGFVGDAAMMSLFQEFLPMPAELQQQGVDEQSFYNCLSCYSEHVDAIPFDAAAFAAAVDERIVSPLRMAQNLFAQFPHLTRMTSSVSPVEMTVDPTFVFNDDMTQDVEQQRSATLQMLCGFGGAWNTAPRRLVLEDGRGYDLPSEAWFQNAGITEYQYLEKLMSVYALIIEQTGADGEPIVLFDYSEQALADAEAFNGDEDAKGGCGCTVGSPAGAAAGMLVVLGLLARRRLA